MICIKFKSSGIICISLLILFNSVSCQKQSQYKQMATDNAPVKASPEKSHSLDDLKNSIQRLPDESTKISDTTVFLNGSEVINKGELYAFNNRIYIPIEKCLNSLSMNYSDQNNILLITDRDKSYSINFKSLEFTTGQLSQKLSKPAYLADNNIYLNLLDFCRVFGYKVKWDYNNKNISLYRTYGVSVKKEHNSQGSKPALIRLEDIAPDPALKAEELEKLRIVSDYLYSEDIRFHIAWIPRYINPKLNIDNDPSSNNSMFNADFIYTLDYMINNGGLTGLHGYTHQHGNQASVDGIEFHTTYKKDSVTATEEYAEDRIKKAMASAKKLDIPYCFFEAPHYAATPLQFSVMEKYFDILYEPYSPDGLKELNTRVYTKYNGGNTVKYIPTPLDCLNGRKDLNSLIKRLDNLKEGYPASLFFHPYLEYEFINLNNTQYGYSEINYSQDSYLHKIIAEIRSRGYEFKSVKEL